MSESRLFGEVFEFMQGFGIDALNRFGEMIIDVPTNTYAYVSDCETIEDVKTRVVYAISRPIYKGLEDKDADRILDRFNRYFEVELTREDFGVIYCELCYSDKLDEFKQFMIDGFPMVRYRP